MIVTILTSISKIAIFAFIATFGAILVELYLLSRRNKTKKEKKNVEIPDFSSGRFKPSQQSKVEPILVKKASLNSESHGLTAQYFFGLIGLCSLVFVIVALGIWFKSSQETQIVEKVELPSPRPQKISPTLVPYKRPIDNSVSALDVEEPTGKPSATPTAGLEVGILAQAPSPTPLTVTPSTTPKTPSYLISITPTSAKPSPTQKAKVTLPATGGYNASILLVILAMGLIAFAFIF